MSEATQEQEAAQEESEGRTRKSGLGRMMLAREITAEQVVEEFGPSTPVFVVIDEGPDEEKGFTAKREAASAAGALLKEWADEEGTDDEVVILRDQARVGYQRKKHVVERLSVTVD